MEDHTPVHSVSMELLQRLEIFRGLGDFELSAVKGFHIFHTPARGCSGGFGYLFLTVDDEVFGFGHNCENINILGLRQSNSHFRQETVLKPTRIDALSGKRIHDISIGGLIGAAVAACGTLLWWGLCYKDDGMMSPRSPAEAASKRTKFLKVSCGYQFMVALSVANRVQVWGKVLRDDQRFFQGEYLNLDVPIIEISCGLHHLAMLDKDGFVYTWGRGQEGQRGFVDYSTDQKYVVWKVLHEPCSLVKCGPCSTYCLTKKFQEVYACGSNSEVNLSTVDRIRPAKTLFKTVIHGPITDLAIVKQPNSKELVAACTSESEFYTWGSTNPHPVLTDTSSMIEVFALWNMTPGLTHISCLPSFSTPVCDRSYAMLDDVLNYIYLKDRPELAFEADMLFYLCETPNLRYYASLLTDEEKAGSFILQKFLVDLSSKNQIPPAEYTAFEGVVNSRQTKIMKPDLSFQNRLGKPSSQSFSQSSSNQSSRPKIFYGFMHHLWSWDE